MKFSDAGLTGEDKVGDWGDPGLLDRPLGSMVRGRSRERLLRLEVGLEVPYLNKIYTYIL